MSFNDVLRDEFSYRDICIKEFAKKVNIPYRTLLSYINAENKTPSIQYLYKIARELNVTMEYLVSGNEKDNFIKESNTIIKELQILPPALYKSMVSLIHLLYEMNKKKEI